MGPGGLIEGTEEGRGSAVGIGAPTAREGLTGMGGRVESGTSLGFLF